MLKNDWKLALLQLHVVNNHRGPYVKYAHKFS